ncbi:hypothetical protein [Pseudonocardia sp. DLS-67]
MGRWVGRQDGRRALSRDERRRFAEIARRIGWGAAPPDQDESPGVALVPVRLAAVGLLVVAATGVLTGLARGDGVVLVVVGAVPAAVALSLLVVARTLGSASPPSGSRFERCWAWLTARGDGPR